MSQTTEKLHNHLDLLRQQNNLLKQLLVYQAQDSASSPDSVSTPQLSAAETAAARHRAAVSLLQTSVAKRSSLTQMEHIARIQMTPDAPNNVPEMIPRKRAASERVRTGERTMNEDVYGHERAGTAYERRGPMDVPSKYPPYRGLPCEQEPRPPPLECWQPTQRAPATAPQPRSLCLSPPRHRCLSPPRKPPAERGGRPEGRAEDWQEEGHHVCCEPRQLWPATPQCDQVGQGEMSEDIPQDMSPASSTNVQSHLPSLPGSPYWTEALNTGDLPDGETSAYKNKEIQNALRAWLMPRRRLQAVHHPSHKCPLEQKVDQKRAQMKMPARGGSMFMLHCG